MEQMYVNGQYVTLDPYRIAKRLDDLEKLLKYIIENGGSQVQALIKEYYLELQGNSVKLDDGTLRINGDNVSLTDTTLAIN